MKTPTLILLDEINCHLVNFDYDVCKYFNRKFTYDVPNARFNPKFQLGIWDGKISFFDKNGKTYIKLLDRIIPDLVKIGIKFEVVDNRKVGTIELYNIDEKHFEHIIHPETLKPLILRPYQVEAVNTLLDNKGGMLLAATGAGKTSMTAALCEVYNKSGYKSLVIVPSTSLVKQTIKTLKHCELDTGELSGKVKDPDHKTVVSTWQTLQNIPALVADFDMVIVDECHSAKGQVIQNLLSQAGANIKYRYGLTGTLPKDEIELLNIENVLGDVIYTISARYLIDNGYLADLHITIKQLEEDFHPQYNTWKENNPKSKTTYANFKANYFPDYTTEKSYLRTNNERVDLIANKLIECSYMGNVFALIDNIQFGKKLLKNINEKIDNEHVYFVSGKDDVKDRQKVYDLFLENDNIIVIATVHCAGVGVDISRIYELFLIDLGKSFIRTIQAIGRGLRIASDKKFLNVTDMCSDLKYSKRHVAERVKYYNEAEYPNTKEKIKY